MVQLVSLAESLGAFTGSALLLALIASVVLIASEELFRGPLNDLILRSWFGSYGAWLKNNGIERSSVLTRLGRWVWLPYRQMTGVIASILQSTAFPDRPIVRSTYTGNDDLYQSFVLVGARLLDFDPRIKPSRVEDGTEKPSRVQDGIEEPQELESRESLQSMLADRALDHLQATFALQWARLRYATAALAIALTFGIVQIQLGSSERFGFLHTVLGFPAILVIAVFFAPLFRDIIERVTLHQR